METSETVAFIVVGIHKAKAPLHIDFALMNGGSQEAMRILRVSRHGSGNLLARSLLIQRSRNRYHHEIKARRAEGF